MPSLVKSKDAHIRMLDPRIKPQWDLLDLSQDRQDYEHEFFQSTISEITDIHGFVVDYYVYNPKSIDLLYGEATQSELDGPYRTKLLIEPFKEPYLINVFGLQGDQRIELAEMPKAIFCRDVQEQVNLKYDLDFDPEDLQPKPGDVVHCLWNNERYELTSVTGADKVFQGVKHIWSFSMKPYRLGQDGPSEKELIFEFPSDNDTDDRNNAYNHYDLDHHNKEKYELSSKQKVEPGIDPSHYGYLANLKLPKS